MKLNRWVNHSPYGFVVALELVIILGYLLTGTIASLLKLTSLALYGIVNFGLAIIAIALMTGMGWWQTVGFRRPSKVSDFWYYLPPFLPVLINFIPGVWINSTRHLIVVIGVTLLVGFVEESFFRGLMLNTLISRGAWKAVAITALLFGMTHAINGLTGKDLTATAVQIFYAIAIGLAFAALALRKGLIWPLILAHFLTDSINMLQNPRMVVSSQENTLISAAVASIFTAYAVFLMVEEEKPAMNTESA